MALKFLDVYQSAVEQEKALYISAKVRDRVENGTPMNYTEWVHMRGNSWEFEAIYPLLDNEALCYVAQTVLDNCLPRKGAAHKPCTTYDEAAVNVFLPLLIKRLREKEDK